MPITHGLGAHGGPQGHGVEALGVEARSQICSQPLGHLRQVPFPSGTQVFLHNDRCPRAILARTLEGAGACQVGRSLS